MKTERMLDEIREANLTYLMLAQRLIREDRAQALYRLGLSEPVAEVIGGLSAGQILKIAASNLLMCAFRFNDDLVWNLLTGHSRQEEGTAGAAGMHAAILMAGRVAQPA
jgi:flagellar transcriptional activator FlhD